MDAVAPAQPQLRFEGAPGEVQPGLAEVGAARVLVVEPDHDGRGVGHEAEALLAFAHRVLGLAALRDVEDGADEPLEVARSRGTRHGRLEHPAVLAVVAAESVVGLEWPLRGAGRLVDRGETRQVVGMDAVARAEPELLLEGAAGEVEPGLVEVGRHALRIVGPDHHGRRVGHAAEALLALPQRLLRAPAFGDVVDDPDHAHDLAGRVAVRPVGGDEPAGVAGLGNRVPHVRGRRGIAPEGPLEEPVDALFAQERKELERPAADDLARGQARHPLHVLVPDDQTQVPVVDDDALAGAGDDLLPELVGLLQLLAGTFALGDVLDDALVVEEPPGRVAHGAGALPDRDDLAAVALPLQLHVVDLALALETLEERAPRLRVDVDLAQVDGHEAFARGKAEELEEGGIGVENLTRQRGAVEADRHALEQSSVARLGLARNPPAGRFVERRSNRGNEPGEVMRVLQDVVVEARLHRRDRELLASGAGAQEHRKIRTPLAHFAEEVERVDPAGAVVGEDDVVGTFVEHPRQVRRIGDLAHAHAWQSLLEGLDDQGAIARALVDDENPQRFA